MSAPEEIYLTFENGFVSQACNAVLDSNGASLFLKGTKPIKYIRADLVEHSTRPLSNKSS